MGLGRWLLRECVRANPFYAISAMLIAYGVLELNTRLDPQIGHAGGILLALSLLHFYEWALLGTAAVLLPRARAGRDAHGLAFIAALFLCGSFLALDELAALWPHRAPALVGGALALAWFKLRLYASLPGLRLTSRVRLLALAVLAAHAGSPLLGAATVQGVLGAALAQDLAWLAGWLSFVPLFLLLWAARPAPQELFAKDPDRGERPDVLAMPAAGAWLLAIASAGGLAHLVAADWVFDRPFDPARGLPAATLLLALGLLRRRQVAARYAEIHVWLAASPALALQAMWRARSPWSQLEASATLVDPVVQFTLAAALAYVLLALATGRRAFYWGLGGPLGAPAATGILRLRESLPHFRAFVCTLLGFLTLGAALLVSLYRERLLRWLEPPPPPPPPRPEPPRAFEDDVADGLNSLGRES
ncbi:MAG: hypothetical protein M5U26_29605 [Planctomycetota bacterium]|nr:hypothetical protein [Planctomycetota bacterium]